MTDTNCRWCGDESHDRYCAYHEPGDSRLFEAQFVGRRKGAQGITYPITAQVRSDTQERAVFRVYEDFEHITSLVFKELTEA